MKTLTITNIQQPHFDSQKMYTLFKELNSTLPDAVMEDKLYQAFYQVGLLGTNRDAYGFFETAEPYDTKLPPDALVGSMSVRVDYDPNYNYASDHEPAEIVTTESLIRSLCLALAHPHEPVMYPDQGEIDHIRVSIVVAPGKVLTKTFWPQQLGFYIPKDQMFY